MKVLLTGGSGYIGSRTIPCLLQRGYQVHLVMRDVAAAAQDPRFRHCQLHQADLLDEQPTAAILAHLRPSHLLHLAWYTEHGRFWQAAQNIDWQLATLRLAAQFIRQGGQRFVGAGSCAEYEWGEGNCDEATTPCRPATFYGQCKHLAGATVASWMQLSGISHAWGRLFFLYGEDEPRARLVPSVACDLLQGTPARCTDGRQVRDFLHVRDAAAALCALLDSEAQGNVNVASGEPVSIRSLVEQFAAHFPGHPEVRFGDIPAREGEPARIEASVERLRREVGFRPSYTLATGLAATALWWQDPANGGAPS